MESLDDSALETFPRLDDPCKVIVSRVALATLAAAFAVTWALYLVSRQPQLLNCINIFTSIAIPLQFKYSMTVFT